MLIFVKYFYYYFHFLSYQPFITIKKLKVFQIYFENLMVG
jgi:hypothetical protein